MAEKTEIKNGDGAHGYTVRRMPTPLVYFSMVQRSGLISTLLQIRSGQPRSMLGIHIMLGTVTGVLLW